MSKNSNNIDQLYKNALEGHQVKAPAHIKGNVLKGTGQSTFWAWTAAIVATVSVGTLLLLFLIPSTKTLQLYNHRVETLQLAPVQEEIAIKTQETLTETEFEDSSPHAIQTNQIQTKTSTFNFDKNLKKATELSIPTPSKANTKDENLNPLKKVNKVNDVKTGPTTEQLKNELNKTDNFLKNKIKTTHIDKTSTVESDEVATVKETKTTQKEPLDQAINNQKKSTSTIDTQVKTKVSEPDTTTTNHHLPLQSTPLVDTMLSMNNAAQVSENIDSIVPTETIIEDISAPQKNKFFISAVGGPTINYANYGKNEMSTTFENAHVEKIGYFTQVKVAYAINPKLFTELGIGLESQSYNTSFKTTTTTYNINESQEIDYFVYNDTNQVIIDTVYKTKYDTTTIKGINSEFGKVKTQYVQIPLYFGYQLERNKWLFHLKAGVQLNYLLKQQGTYINNNEIFNLDKEHTILKKVVLNYNIGMSAHYNIMQSLYLSGQFNYQFGVQNYYQSNYGSRSIHSLSFGIGIGYRF